MATKKETILQDEFRKRFNTNARFYYDSVNGWMWAYKRFTPQRIGYNFGQALDAVRTSEALSFLMDYKKK
jgi:hypothetical protein